MALVSLREVDAGYGGRPLLEGVSLQIERGERICLLGRNGAGKSTLLKLIRGELAPEAGEVERQPGVRVARLAQEVPQGHVGTIYDEVAREFGAAGDLLGEIHRVNRLVAAGGDAALRAELDRLQGQADADATWQMQQQIDRVLERMGLAADTPFASLSSGMKRRVLLARALVREPDILLLDEPTNHLDIEAIIWLEEFLARFDGTLIFVTHDRVFMQKLATRIIEVDRARLFDWECDYARFQERKQAALEAEAQQQALFDKKLAQEEVWIRKGIEARRTRNEGRVRALKKMREQRRERREAVGNVRMQLQTAERSGNLVLAAEGVGYRYGERPVIRGFSTTIMRGDKVGLIGPNGSGKTTLLRLLLGELTPDEGTLRFGTNLDIAYFDQLRAQLDEEKSALENVGDGNDTVRINGQSRHLVGYLQDFLFTPERARSLVRYLSGGERNRLLLAKLFTKPSNLLVLDEPTNDLDAETLELLEELLLEYPGTLLVVSHDRAFLNHVVTSTLVFEGEGVVKEYVGGYDDWLRQRSPAAAAAAPRSESPRSESPRAEAPRAERARPRKLSYKDERELEVLPQRIESLEAELQELHQTLADPAFYQQGGSAIAQAKARLEALETELQAAYARWETLESGKG